MTSHVGRLYALALALLVFFLAWAAFAARPWARTAATSTSPQLRALAAREHRLRARSVLVRRVVARRWATYRAELQRRQARNAAAARLASAPAPSVRVVTLPPLTITRTS